jgi:hypothetical protein
MLPSRRIGQLAQAEQFCRSSAMLRGSANWRDSIRMQICNLANSAELPVT